MALTLGLIFLRHNHKSELRVPNDYTFHSNPAGTPAAHDFNLSTMEVGTRQPATMRLSRHRSIIGPSPIIEIKNPAHIFHPHPVETLEDFVLAFLFGDVVDS
jgi:hypothetical protein